MIERAARSAAVRPELVRAVIVVESAFNPHAVSKRGAVGSCSSDPPPPGATVFRCVRSGAEYQAGVHYLSDLIARYARYGQYGNNVSSSPRRI